MQPDGTMRPTALHSRNTQESACCNVILFVKLDSKTWTLNGIQRVIAMVFCSVPVSPSATSVCNQRSRVFSFQQNKIDYRSLISAIWTTTTFNNPKMVFCIAMYHVPCQTSSTKKVKGGREGACKATWGYPWRPRASLKTSQDKKFEIKIEKLGNIRLGQSKNSTQKLTM